MEEGQLPGGRLRRVCRGSKFLHKPVPFLYGTNLPGKMAAGSRLTGGTKIQHMRFSPKKWPLEGVLLCYSFTWWMCLLSKFPYLEGTHLFRQLVCLKKVPFKEFPWKLTSYWSSAASILFIPNFQQVSPYFTPSTVHFWIQWPLGLLIPLPFEDGLSQITLVLSFFQCQLRDRLICIG